MATSSRARRSVRAPSAPSAPSARSAYFSRSLSCADAAGERSARCGETLPGKYDTCWMNRNAQELSVVMIRHNWWKSSERRNFHSHHSVACRSWLIRVIFYYYKYDCFLCARIYQISILSLSERIRPALAFGIVYFECTYLLSSYLLSFDVLVFVYLSRYEIASSNIGAYPVAYMIMFFIRRNVEVQVVDSIFILTFSDSWRTILSTPFRPPQKEDSVRLEILI